MRGKGPEREAEPSTSYRDYLRRYVEEARHAGAVPVVVTSLTRRYFTPEGRIRSDLEAYARAARAVARQMHAPLLDLHARSIEVLDRLGPERGAALGTTKADGNLDKTHLNARGSALFGGLVADEMRRAVPDLARYVRGAGTTGKGRTP
jgi:lysophospholipase L1-like esterase